MSYWTGRKVLVTGAGGFIGSHLAEKLVNLGAEVRAFTRYNSRNDEGLLRLVPAHTRERIEVQFGDIRELETVHKVMDGIEVVFHLAASVSAPYSYIHPQEVIDINTTGTVNALTAARGVRIEKFIQTSTCEVYGKAKYLPINEEHPKQPHSPYSASKVAADAIALSYHATFNLPVTVIRPFNTYGPRQSDRAVIPSIISQAMASDKIVVGNTVPTRDFTFVEDIVSGFIKMAETSNVAGKEINLGSGFEISIEDVIKKIVSIIGRNVRLEKASERLRPEQSDAERMCADNSRARELGGWQPTIALEDGLKKTIDFIDSHRHLHFPGEYKI